MKVGCLIGNQNNLEKFRAGLLLLCGFFLFGALLGRVASAAVTDEDVQQLRAYLINYARITQQPSNAMVTCLTLLAAYGRYPLLVFLLGFSAAGLILVPAACVSQAFFLSFSVCCFAKAFGKSGILLAMSAFGIRCLFAVPCTLFLALWALSGSARRMKPQKLSGKQEGSRTADCLLRLLGCLLLLLVGVVIELLLVPELIGAVLTNLT